MAVGPPPRPGGDRSGGVRSVLKRPFSSSPIDAISDEFEWRWTQGESPRAEDYLDLLLPEHPGDAVELIFREYCLARTAGLGPRPEDYRDRFPAHREALDRLFQLRDVFGSVLEAAWTDRAGLPEVGDEVGPYLLKRELGRGAFARVFLAEQANLENRLLVLKVSTRVTPEPQLLARAQHDHIIEILGHDLVNDGAFQLIAMPFLGGATLAAVLDARNRRGGRLPRSGRDLLAALDRVAAPEHPQNHPDRPVRALYARTSFPRALAWIIARLAEALDHADERGVAHGDVKPSNILLAADGTPVLLDFNLAVNWQLAGPRADRGGTLAYMAPERLQAIAGRDPDAPAPPDDRHRADIYALGVVLLEALTGGPPLPAPPETDSITQIAAAYAAARRQGAETMLRAARTPVAPALRAILTRCLAPSPADRYARASELAADLDSWRTDRRMPHAHDPALLAGPRRFGRRFRWPLVVAGLLALVGASFATASWRAATQAARAAAATQAVDHLDRYWDRTGIGVFRSRRVDRDRFIEQGDPAETALRHLTYFGVDGPDDWRGRTDFRSLPQPLRDELEVWLLEQIWRYGQAVADREDAPDDWGRALALIERAAAATPLEPLQDLQVQLRQRLNRPGPAPTASQLPAVTPPQWMGHYLLGVAAEERRTSDALVQYQEVLRLRPESFWGHYRAATVAYRIGDYEFATGQLNHCIAQRPRNPALLVQLAGCLYARNRIGAALEACDQALKLVPDLAESYFARSFLRDQTKSTNSDIEQFERLARRQGRSLETLRAELMLVRGLEGGPDRDRQGSELLPALLELDPENIDARQLLVAHFNTAHKIDEMRVELDRLLTLEPGLLWARYARANLLLYYFNKDVRTAEDDLAYLERHRLDLSPEHLRLAVLSALRSSWLLLLKGKTAQALESAERGLAYAEQTEELQGEAHYALARANAFAARSEPWRLRDAADHLSHCLRSPLCVDDDVFARFLQDDAFDNMRFDLIALLHNDPTDG